MKNSIEQIFVSFCRITAICLCAAAVIVGVCGNTAPQEPEPPVPPDPPEEFVFKPISVKNGRLVYDDGQEVALFGTNYYPMSYTQYSNMKQLRANFDEEIRQDVTDMKACGIQVVRVHVFGSEFSRGDGTLVNDEHLRLLDRLVYELDRQGLYFFCTPIAYFSSVNCSRMGLMFREDAIAAQEKFIGQLLNHTNPYTGRQLKDEPCFGFMEIQNEPFYFAYNHTTIEQVPEWMKSGITEYVTTDLSIWRGLWSAYHGGSILVNNSIGYQNFMEERMTIYLDRMMKAIRGTGAKQPVAAALFETTGGQHPGLVRAISKSAVEAVTDGWYPGGFEQLNEETNQLGINELQAYDLDPLLSQKARMVYEFDIFRTYNNVTAYPLMIRRYRSVGAQVVCNFQYDARITARQNTDWGGHYLNREVTPAKTVAFNICSQLMKSIPMYEKYTRQTDNIVFHNTAISYSNDKQAMYVTNDMVLHAKSTMSWQPLTLPANPKFIMGRGDSQYVKYSGSGYYTVTTKPDNTIHLYVSRNAELNAPVSYGFFDDGSINKIKVELTTTTEIFTLLLPGWDNFKCVRNENEQVAVSNRSFTVIPGSEYVLTK